MSLRLKAPPEWGIEPVPSEFKILRGIDYFVLWASLGVGLLVLLAGSLLSGLSFMEVLIVSITGSLIGSFMLALPGIIGSRYGVPTMVSLRPVLGYRVSYIPTALNIVQLIGWTAFELMIMAKAASMLTDGLLGFPSYHLWLVVFATWCAMLAIYGPLVVVRKWLERVAIWLVYGSTIWITYQVFTSGNLQGWMQAGVGDPIPLLLAIDLVIVMPISWWPLISDYNRFAKRPKSAFLGTISGYMLSNTWFYLLGAALIVLVGITDIVVAIASLFFGAMALILILVDETDNCFADIYSTAVSLQNIFPRVRQWKFIVITVVAGVLLAVTIPLEQYEWFLLMIGALFVPLLGTVAAEFFINRRSLHIEEFYERAPRLKSGNIAAWAAGIAVYVLIVNLSPDIGASLPSFIVALLTSVLLSKLPKRSYQISK